MLRANKSGFKYLLGRAEYNEESGEIRIAGADWVLMRSATLRDLIEGTEKMLGSGAAVVWLEIGKHAGREFAQTLLRKEWTGPTKMGTFLEKFFTQAGWGKIQFQFNLAKKEAVVRIENLATARETKAKDGACHFIRGYIAGICDIVFDANTECVETRCMAKGDPLCEFQVKRKNR